MADEKYILEVKNLCQYFTSGRGRNKLTVKAVDDVSFGVKPAETFGLVGESGCGKTTTGRTIIRLYNPTSGEVFFEGRNVAGPMTRELRKYLTDNIAMIFQDPIESLNPRMTIEEIVGEGLRVRGMKDKAEVRRRVREMLEKVGLTDEHATRYPHEFSGGQRQRIGIARAMIIKPKMIIADEPVSALDVSIQAQVINLLNDLKEEMGLTILFIAHNLSVVKYFSDRIGVMYYGRMVEMARGDDLYKKPLHPYTRALLSAIPEPNPITERKRKRVDYDPHRDHDYSQEQPSMVEIEPEHFVLCSPSELERYRKEYGL
ncbi:MAG TPA: ATP-binding cassette domain-containing protein [Candidatus Avichristensenella intestinipullorum]|uniref:ATP-binding cassette domain-containing protein n=1 Tax=Candidatus Avichristensenella intestinipullorum TaxID=2840693 RepID=A0A9D0YVU6_9FIRM|nr:ATP-binding cassette domain-containing protein [Candidatus Avichristensenella intestinipullorum]